MNDAPIHDQHEAQASDPDGKRMKSPRSRSRAQRRWGGRAFAFGAFLLLTTSITLGASRHHSERRQVMATAEEMREYDDNEGRCRDDSAHRDGDGPRPLLSR